MGEFRNVRQCGVYYVLNADDMKIPNGEIGWVGYYAPHDNLLFVITSKESREWYFLYEVQNGRLVKVGRAKEPPELIEKFKVFEKMNAINAAIRTAHI